MNAMFCTDLGLERALFCLNIISCKVPPARTDPSSLAWNTISGLGEGVRLRD